MEKVSNEIGLNFPFAGGHGEEKISRIKKNSEKGTHGVVGPEKEVKKGGNYG